MRIGPLRGRKGPRWLVKQRKNAPIDPIFGSSFCSTPQKIAIGTAFVVANLLTTTLSVPPSTDVIRGPTVQQSKTIPPPVTVAQPPNLLTSTLAVTVAAPPIFTVVQPSLQWIKWLSADSSRGTAKTLFDDAQLPIGDLPQWDAPDWQHQVSSTPQGSPLVLRDVIVPPFTVEPHFVPAVPQRVLDDTTAGMVVELRPTPFVPAVWQGVQRYPRGVSDTTRGAINVDAQAPIGEAAAWAPIALVRNVVDTTQEQPVTLQTVVVASTAVTRGLAFAKAPTAVRNVEDTSQGSALTLQVVAPPVVVSQGPSTQRRPWQPADTSQESGKVLIPDAQLPVGESATWAPVALVRNVVDTTQKQPITLQVIVVPPPIVNAVGYGPVHRWFQPFDGSEGTAKVLIPDQQFPVGENVQLTPPDRRRPVADTSGSTPVGLFPDVLPIGESVWIGPHRVPVLPADTTRGAYATFYPPAAILPPPPGLSLVLPSPAFVWAVTNTTAESPPVAIQGVLPPVDIPYVQPPQGTGGHGKPHRKRHYVEIEGQYFEVRDHEHAVEILTALHEAAKESAPKAVKEAAATAKEVVVPRMAVVKPDRRVPFVKDLQVQVDAANAQLEQTYRSAQAEYGAWQLAASKRIAEDEEDLHVILIMLGIL